MGKDLQRISEDCNHSENALTYIQPALCYAGNTKADNLPLLFMNILLVYGYAEGTLGNYWKKALAKNHKVISIGPADSKHHLHDHLIQKKVIDIAKFINNLPENKRPQLILQIDSPYWIFLKNLEKINAKTAFYGGDFIFKINTYKYYAKLFDYVCTPSEAMFPKLIKHQIGNIFCIPYAADPKTHKDFNLKRDIDVGFVGHLNPLHNPKRTYLLNNLAKKFHLKKFSNAYGADMARIYSKCKIVINPGVAECANMRTFEATACGAMIVANSSEISLYYEKDKDFIDYKSPQDAVNVINYYLKNPSLCLKIAKSAQQKTLKYHTYSIRAQELISIISTHPQKPKIPNAQLLFKKAVASTQNDNIVNFISRQIDSFLYRYTIPYWYLKLLFQKLT